MSRIVKNYEVHQPPLGEGAMGTVYYAVDTELHREVALKCVRPEVAKNPGVMERFRGEAQAQARLNHPNIAQIWEFFQAGSEYFLAMEFINGPTLAKTLREKVRLPHEVAVVYAIQALRGLDHAHRQNIIHRDIKPANLISNRAEQVKVTDFGIARVRGGGRDTREGMIIGTYEYISPEAAQAKEVSPLSDVYSMGIVLFEMLTGRLPFESRSEYELLKMHIQASRPRVRSLARDVPGAIEDIVLRAMDPKPGRRFASAGDMADTLQHSLDSAQASTLSGSGIWRILRLGGDSREKTPPPTFTGERRRTDISSTCHRVEDLLEQHLFDDAGYLLDAGMRSHPGEQDLIDLRGRLQRQRQQYDQAVTQQAEFVRDLLRRGLAEEAFKAVENALAMYPRAAALTELQRECRRRVDLSNIKAGQMVQVQGRVEELIAAGQFQQAADYVLELLEAQENQSELNNLLARILQARREAERQAAILRCIGAANAEADAGNWQAALATVDAGLGRFPAESRLEAHREVLTVRWQAELRRLAVAVALTEARDLELTLSLRAARERLAKALNQFGEDPALVQELRRVDAGLEAARRDASIGSAVSAAAQLKAARKWQDALDALDRTSEREGRDTRIEELRANVAAELSAHQAMVARAAAEARDRMQLGQWEEAVLGLYTATREFPGERELTGLMQEAQTALAKKRREETLVRILAEATHFSSTRDYPEAVRLLLDAVSQYPQDESLSAALSQTVFDRDTYLAAEKVKTALQRAAALRGEERFEAAIETLRQTLRELPGTPELQEALSELEREWRERQRQTAVQHSCGLVEAAARDEHFQPALDALASALAEWPNDPELLELERRARSSRRQVEARDALRQALRSGEFLEAEARWDSAAQAYAGTLADFPETAAELQPRLAAATARAEEARRQARLAELERQIGEWIEAGLLDEADAELHAAEQEFPCHPGFGTWRETLAEARRRTALEAAIRNAADQAQWLADRQSLDTAIGVLTAALLQCGEHQGLRNQLDSLEATRRQRLAAIEAAIARVEALIEKHDWDGAISAAVRDTEQFPDESRFRALLGEARQSRESDRRANEIERRVSRIDAMLGEKAFDDAENLIRAALRDHAGEPAFEERRRRLEEGRAEHAIEVAFRQSVADLVRLCQRREWEQARQLIAPFLEHPKTQPFARAVLDDLVKQEAQHSARAGELEDQARTMIADGRYGDALALLERSALEFSNVAGFVGTLAEVREGAARHKAERLVAAESAIRAWIAADRCDEALREAEALLREYPREKSLKGLRALVVAAMEEQTAIGAVVEKLQRLVAAGEGAESDRVLVEALRRYPGRKGLEAQRAAVDAARQAEWETHSREAGLKRATAQIDALLAKGEAADAALALTALEKEYGKGILPEAARRVREALAEAKRLQVEAAKLLRQAEKERRAQELETGFQGCRDEAEQCAAQGDWEQARQLVAPYLHHTKTKPPARALLSAYTKQEAAVGKLQIQARELLNSGNHAEALALLDDGAPGFPGIGALQLLWQEAREAVSREQTSLEVAAATETIRGLLAAPHDEAALQQADAILCRYPGEGALQDLRTLCAAAITQIAVVADLAAKVQSLVAQGESREAERVLGEAERRYPERAQWKPLHTALSALRLAEAEQLERESALKREVAAIDAMLARKAPAQALAAFKALEARHGKGAAPQLWQRIVATTTADEAQSLREEARRQELELDAGLRRVIGESGQLCRQGQWEAARELVRPYLKHSRTQGAATAVLAELLNQEAHYHARVRELEEKVRAALGATQWQAANALLEQAATEFPEVAAWPQLQAQVREGLAATVRAETPVQPSKPPESGLLRAVGEAGRLCKQGQWEQARLVLTPFLGYPRTRPTATAILSEMQTQEAQYTLRVTELAERAGALLTAGQYPQVVALLEPAVAELQAGKLRSLLEQAREAASRPGQGRP